MTDKNEPISETGTVFTWGDVDLLLHVAGIVRPFITSRNPGSREEVPATLRPDEVEHLRDLANRIAAELPPREEE